MYDDFVQMFRVKNRTF